MLSTLLSTGFAQKVMGGFMTGQEYLELSVAEKNSYSMGFANGLLSMPLATNEEKSVQWINTCLNRMKSNQVAAIIEKHLRENPGDWHHPLNITSYQALFASCERK